MERYPVGSACKYYQLVDLLQTRNITEFVGLDTVLLDSMPHSTLSFQHP
jgi:hypothetical protein